MDEHELFRIWADVGAPLPHDLEDYADAPDADYYDSVDDLIDGLEESDGYD